jgi:CheY-like chemotaxis protein
MIPAEASHSMTIPTEPSGGARGPSRRADKARATAKRRILVVDDHKDAAEGLGMLLQIAGNEVRLAHDGLEAVEAAAAFLPDVVLLDIGLPTLDGYEAARRIRDAQGLQVLLIAVTGWGQEEDRLRSKEAGFDHHLTKPIRADVLQELLGPRR